MRLREVDGEVDPGTARAHGMRADIDPGQGDVGRGGVLQGEHDLEQRVVGGGADGIERLDEVLERQVLVGVGLQAARAYLVDQFGERRIPAGVRSQHQGVHEEPDELVERLVRAAGYRAADRDVVTRPELAEQRGQRGLHHHEDRGPRGAGQRHHTGVDVGAEGRLEGRSPIRRDGGPGPVRGQVEQRGQAGQPVRPVPQLSAHQTAGIGLLTQEVPLPQRVVRVLHREGAPGGGRPGAPRTIGRAQVGNQPARRPAVAGDVVGHQQQDVVLGAQAEQPGTEGNLVFEFEAPVDLLRDRRRQFLLGRRAELPVGRGRSRVEDQLPRPVLGVGEHRAQRLVPDQEVPDRGVEGVGVELTVEAEGDRHRVGPGRPLELVQEPQPALGERQRHRVRAFRRHQRRAGHPGSVERASQARGCGSVEQQTDGQLHAESGPNPADQPGRQQRVPAHREEVVIDTDHGNGEYLGEQAAQHLLVRCAESTPTPTARRDRGSGKRREIELAVGRQRDLPEGDQRGWHAGRG